MRDAQLVSLQLDRLLDLLDSRLKKRLPDSCLVLITQRGMRPGVWECGGHLNFETMAEGQENKQEGGRGPSPSHLDSLCDLLLTEKQNMG